MEWYGHDNAEIFETQAEDILGLLPGQLTQGSFITPNITKITYKDSATGQDVLIDGYSGKYEKGSSITIFYPELMTAPITIPTYSHDNEKGQKMSSVYNQIIKDIYKAAENGVKIKPIDYKNLINSYFTDGENLYDFDALNNADFYMHLGLIDDPSQWSGGDGVVQPDSFRPSATQQTDTGTGDSMSDF